MNKTRFTWHHRKPKSLGGTSEPRNMSELPNIKHAAWTTLVGDMPPEAIAALFNAYYLDPDYEFIVRRKRYIEEGLS